jgi:hypothetical protein
VPSFLLRSEQRCWHGIPRLSAPSTPFFAEHGGPARRVSCLPESCPPRIFSPWTAVLSGGRLS